MVRGRGVKGEGMDGILEAFKMPLKFDNLFFKWISTYVSGKNVV